MKKVIKIFALLCVIYFAASTSYAQISVGVSVRIAPPALPVYVQPACPYDGYLWQPGYWAYDDTDGYYWVPGVWVAPPQPSYLWTPCYWGFEGGYYGFHPGYWGLHVGFYGGINYGFGYGGWGYGGGRWEGDHFRYNTAVVNVNTTVVHNTYIDRTVVNNTYVNNHTSFNGQGGVNAQPRPEEQAAMREQHIQPTSEQISHQQNASKDKSQFASVNNGHPAAAAMRRVGGRPLDERGQVSTSSTLGRNGAGINNGTKANLSRPIHSGPQPGQSNNAANQHQQQQRPQQQPRMQRQPQPPRPQPHNNPKPQQREKHP